MLPCCRAPAAALALVSLLSLPACLVAQGASVPAAIAGVYGLAQVDGQDLPVLTGEAGGCVRRVTGGRLEIVDRSFTLRLEDETDCGSSASSGTTAMEGVFSGRGDTFMLQTEHGALQGTREGEALHVAVGGRRFTFRPGAAASAMERYFEAYERQLAEAREGAYDCATDPLLDGSRIVLPADTAGLSARIAESFPGWHLSTEEEAACRFPFSDGSTPSTFIPAFGTGEAWWVQRADLDADGRRDVVTILTSDANAGEDRLVALFASGGAAEIAPLGGWGFEIHEEDGTPLVLVVYWDKHTDAYRWSGAEFELVAGDDECCE